MRAAAHRTRFLARAARPHAARRQTPRGRFARAAWRSSLQRTGTVLITRRPFVAAALNASRQRESPGRPQAPRDACADLARLPGRTRSHRWQRGHDALDAAGEEAPGVAGSQGPSLRAPGHCHCHLILERPAARGASTRHPPPASHRARRSVHDAGCGDPRRRLRTHPRLRRQSVRGLFIAPVHLTRPPDACPGGGERSIYSAPLRPSRHSSRETQPSLLR